MKSSRYIEEQIIGILKQHQAGLGAKEICRKYGISDATFYKWRSRFGGMEVSDARKLKALEEENRKLKKLLAETALDATTLKPDFACHCRRCWLEPSGGEVGGVTSHRGALVCSFPVQVRAP